VFSVWFDEIVGVGWEMNLTCLLFACYFCYGKGSFIWFEKGG
jgi:hypothetical protein